MPPNSSPLPLQHSPIFLYLPPIPTTSPLPSPTPTHLLHCHTIPQTHKQKNQVTHKGKIQAGTKYINSIRERILNFEESKGDPRILHTRKLSKFKGISQDKTYQERKKEGKKERKRQRKKENNKLGIDYEPFKK